MHLKKGIIYAITFDDNKPGQDAKSNAGSGT